jgi:hypothetical protein
MKEEIDHVPEFSHSSARSTEADFPVLGLLSYHLPVGQNAQDETTRIGLDQVQPVVSNQQTILRSLSLEEPKTGPLDE